VNYGQLVPEVAADIIREPFGISPYLKDCGLVLPVMRLRWNMKPSVILLERDPESSSHWILTVGHGKNSLDFHAPAQHLVIQCEACSKDQYCITHHEPPKPWPVGKSPPHPSSPHQSPSDEDKSEDNQAI